MKLKRTHAGKPAVIANSRWFAYATAGAASAFTCAHSADAAIHYSGIIRSYSGHRGTKGLSVQLDQPGDSFRLRRYVTFFSSAPYAHFGVRGLAGAGFAGFYCPNVPQVASVSKLSIGQFISTRPFPARESGLVDAFGNCSGQFHRGEIGFVGFKFNNGNGDQYGWVRIQMGRPLAVFSLVDYAYADPGEPIRAGQTSSDKMVPEESNEVVPEEGSLGALALGAAGLLAWRKRRSGKL
jgi:hypothetical protein